MPLSVRLLYIILGPCTAEETRDVVLYFQLPVVYIMRLLQAWSGESHCRPAQAPGDLVRVPQLPNKMIMHRGILQCYPNTVLKF